MLSTDGPASDHRQRIAGGPAPGRRWSLLLRMAVVLTALVTLVSGLVSSPIVETGGPAGAQEASGLERAAIAVKFVRAEATRAEALAAVERLRSTRSEVRERIADATEGGRSVSALQAQVQRLQKRLDYQWTRWRRANRRAYAAKQAAQALDDAAAAEEVVSGPTEAQWEALRQCESGGNYSIVSANGLYYGAYQFSLSTWASVGGTGSPAEASEAEQDQRARILYDQRGASPWPHCGRYL